MRRYRRLPTLLGLSAALNRAGLDTNWVRGSCEQSLAGLNLRMQISIARTVCPGTSRSVARKCLHIVFGNSEIADNLTITANSHLHCRGYPEWFSHKYPAARETM